MIRALTNRVKILNLKLSFTDRMKILFYSCLLPFSKKLQSFQPSFAVAMGSSPISIHGWTDLGTFLEIFLHEEYRVPKSYLVTKRILDIGANTGYASIFFAQMFPQAQIIAVEADEDNVKSIRENTAPYNGRIVIEPSALSAHTGMVDFYRNFHTSISGSTMMRDEKAEKISVPAMTLSDLEKKYGTFDIIKFDIEGGEWNAIIPDMLTSQPRVWIGEYHEDLTRKSKEEFIARFRGYTVESRKIARQRFLLTFSKK